MVHDMDEREQRVARERPRFYAALMALGDSDPKRAAALGVQRMTVARYRLGLANPRKLVHSDFSRYGSAAKPTDDPVVAARRAALMAAWLDDERAALIAA